ncbi:MAG: SDR family NAD(P)-dependent oxidoreductase [Pseudomonadota bacterium]
MSLLAAFEEPVDALVVGANGGLGRAFVDALLAEVNVRTVHAWSRNQSESGDPRLKQATLDVGDEEQLKEAADQIERLSLIIVATGILHGPQGLFPEKSWRALAPEHMAENFRINAILPALVIKHVVPRIPRKERAVIGALSARVGSISDNRLGGWHSYRASKSALNQLIKCLSIELRRTHPEAICLALHPGTVDTGLSEPFQKSLVAGHRLFTPDESAAHLLRVMAGATTDQSGCLMAWDGELVEP